jgi:transposase InsO family protein
VLSRHHNIVLKDGQMVVLDGNDSKNCLTVGVDCGVFKIAGDNAMLMADSAMVGQIMSSENDDRSHRPLGGSEPNKVSLYEAHTLYGHVNYDTLVKMNDLGMLGVNLKDRARLECSTCMESKQIRSKIPKESHTEKKGTVVHSDIWVSPRVSYDGCRYFVTFIEDETNYVVVYTLKHKDEVLPYFKIYFEQVKAQTGRVITGLMSDNGGEYKSREFAQYCNENGIHHWYTLPYSSFQNGVAERMNRTLVEMTRCLLNAANMPARYWSDAVKHSATIRNLVLSTDKTEIPYVLFLEQAPDYSRLHTFGQKVYVLIPKEKRNKLSPTSRVCTYLGIDKVQKGIRVLESNGKVTTTRDYRLSLLGGETAGKSGQPQVTDTESPGNDSDSEEDFVPDKPKSSMASPPATPVVESIVRNVTAIRDAA